MFAVEFNKETSAAVSAERKKSVFEKYRTSGVSGRQWANMEVKFTQAITH